MSSGASGRAPPSFSSFPEPDARDRQPRPPPPPPPSFASFPIEPPATTTGSSSSKKKRPHRARDFLDELGAEIGIVDRDRKRSTRDDHDGEDRKRRHDRDRHRDKGEGEKRKHRSDNAKGEGRSKQREPSTNETRRTRDGHSGERTRTRNSDSDQLPSATGSTNLVYNVDATATRVEDRGRSEKPLFYESRKGDDLNIVYGGLHRGDVSRYYRQGAGRVLGLNDGLRITKDTAYAGRGLEIAPLNRFKTPRYVDPSSAKFITDKNTKRITLIPRKPPIARVLGEIPGPSLPPGANAPAEDVDAPFIAFGVEKTRTEKIASLEHEEGTEYRSIAGLVHESDVNSDSDVDGLGRDDEDDATFANLGISGGESRDEYLKRRTIELDRALRDDPNNVERWLEFVELQDEVAQTSFVGSGSSLGNSGATRRALSQNERTSTAEIKLAVLTRALSTTGNEGSERLLLAYLRAAAQVEDPKKVLERWKETLRDHPDLTGLWIEYVSWRQTSWVNFAVSDVVEVFEECLDVLMLAMLRQDVGSSGLEIVEGNAIYLFLRLCLMLRQAGYSERAFAAFQALVELNLFRPKHLDLARPEDPRRKWTDRVIDELEEFWDSEAPRIGEPKAKGWNRTTEDELAPDSHATASLAPSHRVEDVGGARALEKWAKAERTASATAALPARATDPSLDDSDDPYRVALFDDLRSFLFVVHSPDSKLQLAYAFLTFLGLPFVPPDFTTSNPFTTDAFIHSELVERPSLVERFWPATNERAGPYETIGGEAMEPERRSALGTPFEIPFHATPAVVDQLFPTASPRGEWFATIRKRDLEHVELEQARNALGLLVAAVRDPFLHLDIFALEAACSTKGAVKAAKQILRDHRQDLSLWDGFARIERQRGKIADARQVYCTALSMYRSFKPNEQIDGPLLWRSWAEMEWEEGNSAVALKVVVAASKDDQVDLASLAKSPDVRPSSTEILRTRQYYSTLLEASFQPKATQSIVRNRDHLAYSAALLALLTQGLDAATEVVERHLFRLESTSSAGETAEHEEAYMLYAKLLYRHSTKGPYKPAQLREVLERAITQYKNNTLFLGLFYHNELRMKIQNRIRKTLEEHVLRDKDATSEGYLFAIFAELHLDARSRNVWAVRNLFDRAVENPNTKSSPSIWTLYIDFEVRNGELERAKALIYRALRECPWCKEFYLRPFSPTLRGVYRSSELRDFHRLLLEKGLRVRIDVDPFVVAEEEEEIGDDVEMEDEAPSRERGQLGAGEQVFAERQRLLPY